MATANAAAVNAVCECVFGPCFQFFGAGAVLFWTHGTLRLSGLSLSLPDAAHWVHSQAQNQPRGPPRLSNQTKGEL